MTLIPSRIKDGRLRNGMGQLVSVIYKNNSQWFAWLEADLKKNGGLTGLVKTDKGWTNQPIELKEVA